ncbi:nad-binding protein, partial [Colletotrichum incanum]
MALIKSVAIVGGTGDLGKILSSQLDGTEGFDITVISRQSTVGHLIGLKSTKADYDSVESLTAAFRGFDAVVNALPGHLEAQSLRILDAAVAAGVRRFIPSEWGSDRRGVDPKKFLLPQAKSTSKKSCSSISPRAKLNILPSLADPGLSGSWRLRAACLYLAGSSSFMTRKAFGEALVGALRQPDASKNRIISVRVIQLSQNRILELTKEAFPKVEFMVKHIDTQERFKRGSGKLFSGQFDPSVVTDLVCCSVFDVTAQTSYQSDEDELAMFGVQSIVEEDFVEFIR